jgi:hypothetical protein
LNKRMRDDVGSVIESTKREDTMLYYVIRMRAVCLRNIDHFLLLWRQWDSSIANRRRTTAAQRRRNQAGGGLRVSSSQAQAIHVNDWLAADTAFKQQRLKAWQPILTPKTVLPTLFIIAILFGPIGGLLIWGSSQVSEITFDYTDCETLSPSTSATSPSFSDLTKFSYRLRSKDVNAQRSPPTFALINDSANADVSQRQRCIIEFDIPANLDKPVFLYYKLTNFFQNHRRYVKSLDSGQLKGQAVSARDLDKSDCKPLATSDGKAIYPCGLIANSVFNGESTPRITPYSPWLYSDSFSGLEFQNPPAGTPASYIFSEKGIAWPGEAKKYAAKSSYNLVDIVPPPNWRSRFPDGYTDASPPPNLREDEHFQNWMRTAGLPTFTKLWGRNDQDTLLKGRYRIVVNLSAHPTEMTLRICLTWRLLDFPVRSYKGTKSIVISTVSWIGGKNPFLGWAYVTAAGVFVLLAIAGTIRHIIKPRWAPHSFLYPDHRLTDL